MATAPRDVDSRGMTRRELLGAAAGAGLALSGGGVQAGAEGELLYNGIRMPAVFPPKPKRVLTLEPTTPPYLEAPPEVIPIDVGRQLFVDDFLIERTDLKRTFHLAKYHSDNPVLKPDRDWEMPGGPTAMVFSDGVWHDPNDGLFKMWYMGGYIRSTCYAVSRDGFHWMKPPLDVVPGTNIVQPGGRDSTLVWLDHATDDPTQRFKLFRSHNDDGWALSIHTSPDGIHWSDRIARSGPCGDRTTVFYNPFRKKWVYSIRGGEPGLGRIREYHEGDDILEGADWRPGGVVEWVGADRLDPKRSDLKIQPQLYNLDCVAYESLLLGFFSIWRGQPRDRAKPNEVVLGYSRDGFHWHRPDRRALVPVSERHGDWNWGNVQSAGGGCLVVGDKLHFYVSGRAGVKGSTASGVSSTGLATLRRDGFASLDADAKGGAVETRAVKFSGRHLFVNLEAPGGELRVEVLDRRGRVIAPFSARNCGPVTGDGTKLRVEWKDAPDLARLAGKPVRFRFRLRRGKLYAFWVSAKQDGASGGYVAAGGPGFSGPTDG